MQPRIGFDLGGVIRISKDRVLMPGAAHGLMTLRQYFGSELYIISRRRREKWGEGHDWVQRHLGNFFPIKHVWFCLERRDKSDFCLRYEITHFVDDRLEVLY